MARCETRWLLSILLAALPGCSALPGPPPPPSAPQCHIPNEEYDRAVLCVWEPRWDVHVPTTYTLLWESAYTKGQEEGTKVNGSIPRSRISSHDELSVWVRADNQHGSATSERATFNTADIIKPSTPSIISHTEEPLEIYWNTGRCDALGRSEGDCEVRHRTEGDQAWPEVERGFLGVYMMEDPQFFTVYEFQVRCDCSGSGGLMSDWSPVYRVESAKAAPVGELDVWRDCGISSANSECVLVWKKLPIIKARGPILGYEVTLSYSNGTVAVVNASAAEAGGQLMCDEVRCHLTTSLTGVSAADVAAYSAQGATTPAPLTMSTPGTWSDKLVIHLKMDEESISVSWDLLSQSTERLKEYVVQYKQAGLPPSQGFDWIRVNKSQTSAILRGQFKNYTAYEVSLFTVFQSSAIQQLSSVIGYVFQGIPSRVSSLKVVSIDATRVTLFWEPIPLTQRNGVILCYQIGVNSHEVYNVSVSTHHENTTFRMERLSPGQEYEVWLRAVTEAGPGPNATTRFKTMDREDYGFLLPLLVVTATVAVACIMCTILSFNRVKTKNCPLVPQCCFDKVPDPGNSLLFRQMKYQFNGSLAWICIPIPEPNTKVSQVEVMGKHPQAYEARSQKTPCSSTGLTEEVVADQSRQTERDGDREKEAVREWERTEGRSGFKGEDYSKMIDSDEERDGEEGRGDPSSSSEEDPFFSGYEKHFMPTDVDV